MNLQEIKNSLEPTDIKNILAEYGVTPYKEESEYFIFPTCCHNLEGGSKKLYYYFDSKLFVCYTECNDSFNIFELIQKMEGLHGYKINIFEAADKIGLGTSHKRSITTEEIEQERILRFIQDGLSKTQAPKVYYEAVEKEILNNLSFNAEYLKSWVEEGMTQEVLEFFQIGYSIKDLAIAIPHHDEAGNLIGVRGRFMAQDALNKYMPLSIGGILRTHSLRGNLYGLYQNKKNIEKLKRAVLFEGEKSVLKFASVFGQDNNIALATCGNKVTNEQINLLVEFGVEEVILAFDRDFKTPYERDLLMEKYNEIGIRLSKYFRTAIIIDFDEVLDYKDSPIDKGKDIFNNLYQSRYYIGG